MSGVTSPAKRSPVRPYAGVSAAERIASRRERLLDAGLELYGTRGYAATGVKDVCRQAGLTDRYFYESFRDSGELFVAVFDRGTAELFELVREAVAGVAPQPEAQARAAVDSFVRALSEDPRKARVIFTEAARAGAEADRHMRATLRQFASLIVETARPHLAAGVAPPTLQMGAAALVGAIERVIIEWQDGELDASIEEIVDYLVELFLAAGPTFGLPPRAR